MGAARTTPKVVTYLSSRAGQQVTVTDIMKATGLEKLQIQNAISSLIRNNLANIDVIVRATVWVYHTDAKPAAQPTIAGGTDTGKFVLKVTDVFELVGFSPNGNILLKHESGRVYRARVDDDF